MILCTLYTLVYSAYLFTAIQDLSELHKKFNAFIFENNEPHALNSTLNLAESVNKSKQLQLCQFRLLLQLFELFFPQNLYKCK